MTSVSWDPSGCCEDSSLEGAKEKQLRDDGRLDQGDGSGNNSDWLFSRCFFCRQSQRDLLMDWVKNIRAREKSSTTIGNLDEPLEGRRSHDQEGRTHLGGKPGGQFWAHQG